MKLHSLCIAVLATLSTTLVAGEEREEGQGAALAEADLPAAVATAVKEAVPGAVFQKAHTEREGGALVYEAMVKAADGRDLEVVVHEAGHLVEVEEEITVGELPAAVSARLAQALPGAAPEEVEKTLLVLYEIEKELDGVSVELVIDALGNVLELEEEGHEGDDDMAGMGEEDEEEGEIPVADLPAAVVATVNALLPGAELDEAEMEHEGGALVYEVEVELADDRELDVAVLADGTLLEVDEEARLRDLPAVVAATLEQVLPGGKVEEVEKATLVVYEVEATVDGKTREVAMDALGRVLSPAPDDED